MALRNVVSIMAFTLLASAGLAFAQTSTSTGATTTNTVSATSTPISASSAGFGITLTPTARIAPGTQDALMALVIMTNGTANGVQTSSLPLSVTLGGGLEASDISDCRVRNVMNLATPLNSTAAGFTNGTNTVSFSSVTIDADSTVTLAVTCDIAADAPLGGTALLGITPSAVAATSGSQSITPVVGPNLSGGTGTTSGTVTLSSTPTNTPFIPGVPNTGSGGQGNVLLLAISGAIAAGAAILMRRRYA